MSHPGARPVPGSGAGGLRPFARRRTRLPRERGRRCRASSLSLQCASRCARALRGCLAPRWRSMPTCVGARRALTGLLASGAFLRRGKIHARATGLRQSNGDGLLRGSGSVLTLSDVVHLLANELSRLCARGLPLPLVSAGSLQRTFLRHKATLYSSRPKTWRSSRLARLRTSLRRALRFDPPRFT